MIFEKIPFNIHCWGGFGSQLFALALAFDIEKQFPKKNIRLLFHTSGVTKRDLELSFIPARFTVIVVHDFTTILGNEVRNTKALLNQIKKFIKAIAYFLHFSESLNNDIEFKRLKPWTIDIRGHYSTRFISRNSISEILNVFNTSALPNIESRRNRSEVAIHYRLGDLLTQGIKSYVPAKNIKNLIDQSTVLQKVKEIDVYSDSSKQAVEFLSQKICTVKFIEKPNKSFETLQSLLSYKTFVGTNSKISIWAVLLRVNFNLETLNYMPYQIKDNLEFNIVDPGLRKRIDFFGDIFYE